MKVIVILIIVFKMYLAICHDVSQVYREVDVMKLVSHPNIVKLYQVDPHHGRQFLKCKADYNSMIEMAILSDIDNKNIM